MSYPNLIQAIQSVRQERLNQRLYFGFAAILDKVISLTTENTAPFLAQLDPERLAGRIANPRYVVHDVYDFWSGVWLQAQAGKGGDWKIEDAATFDWLMQSFVGKWQIGGAAGQGAATLARLGLQPRLNVPWREQRLLALFPTGVQVATPAGFQPTTQAATAETTTIHPIVEFSAGFQMVAGKQTVTAKKSDRLILPFDPTHKEFRIESSYETAVFADPLPKTVLVSGFLVPGEEIYTETAVRQGLAHLKKLSTHQNTLIHLELGECHFPRVRQLIVHQLFPCVNSIGLNENELVDLASDLGFPLTHHEDVAQVVAFAHHVAHAFQLWRVNIHTASYSLAVSQLEPVKERQALAFGNLTAAFRATYAKLGTLEELTAFQETIQLSQKGTHLQQIAAIDTPASNKYQTSFCPAFALTQQKQSIGLGDSYMAATLAILTPPTR